jgi:hypothetical protein
MSNEKINPVVRFLPSLTDVAFLMPLVFLFLRMDGAQRLLADGDTGWHIRTGEWILQNGRVPATDLFSYTKPGAPWYAWEWLWDVIFAWLHQRGGMAAVILVSAMLLCFTFALLFRETRRNCPSVLIAFGATLAATAGSSVHWLARPHLFTLLFVVVFWALLERAREGRTRALFYLPVLTVLWTNIHGAFFAGIILIGCYAAGEITRWLVETDRDEAKAALVRGRSYLITALVSAAATLVNPYSYHLHAHIIGYLRRPDQLKYISEFQSTNFQTNLAQWYEPMLLLGAVAVVWSLYRKRFAHAFLLAGWLHLALFSVRNLPIYLIVAAPIVAATLNEMLQRLADAPLAPWIARAVRGFNEFVAGFGALDSQRRVYATSAAGFLVVSLLFYSPTPPPKFRAEYSPKSYPAEALNVIRGAEFSKSVFTTDVWGGYLIYRLYPRIRVFVDGRFDLYGQQFTEKYIDLMKVRNGWDQTLQQYGVDTILLPVDEPLTGVLKECRRWRVVHDDGTAIVFRSEAALARAGTPESPRASAATPDGRDTRDREITNVSQRDPRITDSNTRSESL